MYERGIAPIGYDARFQNDELEKIRAELERLSDLVDELVELRIIGGVSVPWLWDDTGTTPADPGAGFIRGNSANLNGATALYVSKTDAAGRTLELTDRTGETFIATGVGGDYVVGTITAYADNGAYVTWTFTNVAGAGNPGQGDIFEVRWYPSVGGS